MTAALDSASQTGVTGGHVLARSSCSAVVFRVQDRAGRGPWKPGFSSRWVEDREDHDNLAPWPYELGDAPLRDHISGMAMGCGCLSLEQLRRWFTPSEYRTLQKHGYRAVKMTVGRVLASSEIQCVFERVKPLREDVEPVELYPQNAL